MCYRTRWYPDGEPGRTSRGYSTIRRVGDEVCVDYSRCQPSKEEVIAAINGQVLNAHRVDVIRLLHSTELDVCPRRFAG